MLRARNFLIVALVVMVSLPFGVSAQGDRAPITVENAASVAPLGVLDAGNVTVMSVAFSPDSKFLLTAHPDGVIREWDLTTGESTVLTSPAATWVRAVVYSPDGAQIASADGNNIILWDAKTKEQVSVLEGHTNSVSLLAYSPDGTILASGSWDRTICLWEVSSGNKLHVLETPGQPGDLDFSPDGKIIASVDGNTTGINLWDVASGSALEGIALEDVYYDTLSFNLDGSLLAAAGYDGKVYIWNVADRELVYTLEGHDSSVTALRFSPSSAVLVSGGGDEIRLWDTERGSGFSALKGDFLSLFSLAFNADGTLFASGSVDGLIHLWGVSEGGPLPLPVPEAFTPQPGHWEGSSSSIDVSFDVNADGEIANFHLRWTVGTSYCTIDLTEAINVENNAFAFGPDVQRIEGRFRSATSLFGQSDITQCGNMVFFTTGGPPTWRVKFVE
jgi:WD40 repeat protein